MKKMILVLAVFVVVLVCGVVAFVNHDTKTNTNPVATSQNMGYTVVDYGYMTLDKDGITSYIDPEGNIYDLEE